MLAIIERRAFLNLCDAGLSPDQARAKLSKAKPCATYDGERYYSARQLARLSKR